MIYKTHDINFWEILLEILDNISKFGRDVQDVTFTSFFLGL